MAIRKPKLPENKSRAITKAKSTLTTGSPARAKHDLRKAEERRKRGFKGFSRPARRTEVNDQASGSSSIRKINKKRY